MDINQEFLQADPTPLVFSNESELSQFTETTTGAPEKGPKHSVLPLVGALIFGTVYLLPIMRTSPSEHTCFALLAAVAFLWSTEGLPAYATAYIVPAFSVWFGLGIDGETHERISAGTLASTFAWKFMDPIIFVFLGSMTMSECLAKLNITDRVSNLVFRRLPKNPKFILLTVMMMNLVIAAFLSNVASTTLVLSFTMPIIRSLDPDDPFIKALLFGIGWSGNCGGMPTTIASPQNILALKYMHDSENISVSFVKWMEFGFPVSVLICLAEWGYLCLRFKPQRDRIVLMEVEEEFPPWSIQHTYASIITLLTILLWTLEETFPSVLGNVGITSLLPVIAFFGSGMLTTEDFHGIRWSTLALMGGGLALGEAMKTSGLLALISSTCGDILKSIPMWPLLAIFLLFEGIIGSLINSTSAASILYPVIAILGRPTGHVNLFVCLSALMISGAQLFHISSFPNALVSGVRKHIYGNPEQITQETFLQGPEYFTVGWVTLFIGMLIVSSIGYGISLGLGL